MGFDLERGLKGRSVVDGTGTVVTGTVATGTPGTGGVLVTFQGFLKKAGALLSVTLGEIVKYVVPIAQVVAVADPAAGAEVKAFTTAVGLVETAVLSAQQRWSAQGSAANSQKLADVLLTVEQPIVLLFAQAGVSVDTGYVTNLVNGVVAILNAQPGVLLAAAAGTTGTAATAAKR